MSRNIVVFLIAFGCEKEIFVCLLLEGNCRISFSSPGKFFSLVRKCSRRSFNDPAFGFSSARTDGSGQKNIVVFGECFAVINQEKHKFLASTELCYPYLSIIGSSVCVLALENLT